MRAPLQAARSAPAAAELAAIEAGAQTPYERVLHHDRVFLDAWRVRVMAACLLRHTLEKGEAMARVILGTWPTPIELRQANRRIAVRIFDSPDHRRRWHLLMSASTWAMAEQTMIPDESRYPRECVRIIILGEIGLIPGDKPLRVVRERIVAAMMAKEAS